MKQKTDVTCPCLECENQGCGPYHDKCEAYQGWRKKREAGKREHDVFNDYLSDKISRAKRINNWNK